ncbi:HNH endonuclease signature motif containing protein [Streptomyces sp. NPDC048256]|uniref:HNH endonuclease signature motif containing protein n=1 Tax=Streptomyces sp. NPDC048256 TaxID=3154613 RepID=UPI0033DE26E3
MNDTDESLARVRIAERVLMKIDKTAHCWNWTGSTTDEGYGYFNIGDEKFRAHRWVFSLIVGPIPEGLVLDHLCRNRTCVRPSHLEPVTNRENILRGVGPSAVNAAKVRCLNGHEYTLSNTYVRAPGSRTCRACARDRARVANARSRQKRTGKRETCSVCGLPYAVKTDGTVYRHYGMTLSGFSTGELCPGAGQLPTAP